MAAVRMLNGNFNGVVRSHFMSITVNGAKELRKFSGHQYIYCNRHLQSNGKQTYYNHQAPRRLLGKLVHVGACREL